MSQDGQDIPGPFSCYYPEPVLDMLIAALKGVRTELKWPSGASGRNVSIAQDLLETRVKFSRHRATHLGQSLPKHCVPSASIHLLLLSTLCRVCEGCRVPLSPAHCRCEPSASNMSSASLSETVLPGIQIHQCCSALLDKNYFTRSSHKSHLGYCSSTSI